MTGSVRVVGNPEAHEAPTLAGLLRPVPLGSWERMPAPCRLSSGRGRVR